MITFTNILHTEVNKNTDCQFMKYCSLEAHIVEVDVIGPGQNENLFTVKTIRHNPAVPGAVTGNATYASFLSSMLGETLYFSIAMLKTIVFVMVATL